MVAMNDLQVFDNCYGVITGRNAKGAYLELDNGVNAFARRYANLKNGTKVLCTVLKKPKDYYLTLVEIDSVLEYAA